MLSGKQNQTYSCFKCVYRVAQNGTSTKTIIKLVKPCYIDSTFLAHPVQSQRNDAISYSTCIKYFQENRPDTTVLKIITQSYQTQPFKPTNQIICSCYSPQTTNCFQTNQKQLYHDRVCLGLTVYQQRKALYTIQ